MKKLNFNFNFKFNFNYKVISIILSGILIVMIGLAFVLIRPAYVPSFVITGDVEQIIRINTAQRGLRLSELVDQAKPYSKKYKVVLKGDDSLLAEVEDLEGINITYTDKNAWECNNAYHPASSNIKRLSEVWVVSAEDAGVSEQLKDLSVHIITVDKNIASYTPGQFFMSEMQTAPVFEGRSEKTAQNKKYSVSVYTQRKYKNIKDFGSSAELLLIMGDKGQYQFDSAPGRLELNGNSLQYVFSDGKTKMKGVRGILINPPAISNMDAYRESVNNINKDKRVMVFLVDGLGYHMYTHAVDNGSAPYLMSLPAAKQASTVYEPVTYAGTAAMLTGQPPYKNGVFRRRMPDLKTPDIFEYAAAAGKTVAYIEGNIKILNTSAEPDLNADRNADKSTDDEVFEAAQKAVRSNTEYIFVHFHGVDDMGHSYGDTDERVMQKIKQIDGYIRQLVNEFHGRVIITADHGMHKTRDGGDGSSGNGGGGGGDDGDGGGNGNNGGGSGGGSSDGGDGGNHGIFRYEDMIVPYISFEQ